MTTLIDMSPDSWNALPAYFGSLTSGETLSVFVASLIAAYDAEKPSVHQLAMALVAARDSIRGAA